VLKIYLVIPFFLLGCATSGAFKSGEKQSILTRKIASTSVVSPFGLMGESSPSQIVDAVIERLGPVRNQRNTQLCFGHAVADVATFHTSHRVSAFSVAVRNFQNRKGLDYIFFNPIGVVASQVGPDSRYMLGLASSVLDSIRQTTLCPDDQPASDLTYRDTDLSQLWDTYQTQFRAHVGPKAPVGLYSKMQAQLSRIVPSLDSDDFLKHISRYKPLDYALGEWFDRNCSLRISGASHFRVAGNDTGFTGANQIVETLNVALKRGEPAVVHYDPGVLDALDPSIWQTVIGFHVSTIVARAQLQGEQYYLLRNSWGDSCGIYANRIALRCDRGHIWLSEDEIRKYVSSVAYLEGQ